MYCVTFYGSIRNSYLTKILIFAEINSFVTVRSHTTNLREPIESLFMNSFFDPNNFIDFYDVNFNGINA